MWLDFALDSFPGFACGTQQFKVELQAQVVLTRVRLTHPHSFGESSVRSCPKRLQAFAFFPGLREFTWGFHVWGIFMSIGGLSIQPVFYPQSRHWFEVGEVAREQGGIVSQADAGNFQILCANFLTERFQGIEVVRSIVIPWKHQPGCEYLDLPDEPLVGGDLGSWSGAPTDFGEPAAQ